MTEQHRRLLAGALLPLTGIAVVALAVLGLADSAPDPLATHWDIGGTPDDSSSKTVFLSILGTATVVLALVAFTVSRRKAGRGELAGPIAITAFMQWIAAGVMLSILLANRDAESWEQAAELPVWLAALVPLGAAVAAAASSAIVLPVGSPHERAHVPATSVGIRDSERLVWFSQVRARWPLALAAVLSLLGVTAFLSANRVIGVGLVLAAIVVSLFASVAVSADRTGLVVRYGPLRWPRTRIPLDRIERAEVVQVARGSNGGWGYRGSLTVFGRAAVVIRSGEGLRLHLDRGQRFTVTVDDASTGAGTINDLATSA